MIPVALMSANYAPIGVVAAPPSPPQVPASSGTNVVIVDFKRKQYVSKSVPNSQVSQLTEWLQVVNLRLSRLSKLADGWDGHGSLAISKASLARAAILLSIAFEGVKYPAPPAAVPSGDGSVQLEWWLTDSRFELEIEANGNIEAWGLDRASGEEMEKSGSDAVNLFMRWAGRLTADKLIMPA